MNTLDIVLHILEQKKKDRICPAMASEIEILSLAKKVNINNLKVKADLEALKYSGVLIETFSFNKIPLFYLKE